MKRKYEHFAIKYMFYEGDLHYHIEGFRKGKWRLLFGGIKDRKEAQMYIDNPEMIYAKMRLLRIIGVCIVLLLILAIIFLNK
jgi:hypothetical protein